MFYSGINSETYIRDYTYSNLGLVDGLYKVYGGGEVFTSEIGLIREDFYGGAADKYFIYGKTTEEDGVLSSVGEKGNYYIYNTYNYFSSFFAKDDHLLDYIIYGETEVDEEDEEIVYGVGDLVEDPESPYYGKYEIPIVTRQREVFEARPKENTFGNFELYGGLDEAVYIYQSGLENNSRLVFLLNTLAGETYTLNWNLNGTRQSVFLNNYLEGTTNPVGGEIELPQNSQYGNYSLSFVAQGLTTLYMTNGTLGSAFSLQGFKATAANEPVTNFQSIYLDEPLFKGDKITLADTSVNVAVAENVYNIMYISTMVRPEKVKISTSIEERYYVPLYLNDEEIEDKILLTRPLRKVGEVEDFLKYTYWKNPEIYYYTKELILDGTEDWAVDSEKFYIDTPLSNCIADSPVLCDKINSKTLKNPNLNENIWISNEGKLCIIKDDISLDVEDLVDYLEEETPIAYYQLSSPEIELIYLPDLIMEGGEDNTKKENKIQVTTTITPSLFKIQNPYEFYTAQQLEEILEENRSSLIE